MLFWAGRSTATHAAPWHDLMSAINGMRSKKSSATTCTATHVHAEQSLWGGQHGDLHKILLRPLHQVVHKIACLVAVTNCWCYRYKIAYPETCRWAVPCLRRQFARLSAHFPLGPERCCTSADGEHSPESCTGTLGSGGIYMSRGGSARVEWSKSSMSP